MLSKLDEMDQVILGRCDAGIIVTKIEESDAIVPKVISGKLKINDPTSSCTSVPLPPTSGSIPTIPIMTSKPRLPKLTLPIQWRCNQMDHFLRFIQVSC